MSDETSACICINSQQMKTIILGRVNMIIANIISLIVLFIGGLNWGLVGIFNFNLVDWVFGGHNAGSIIIYILVLLATLWLIFTVLTQHAIYVRNKDKTL